MASLGSLSAGQEYLPAGCRRIKIHWTNRSSRVAPGRWHGGDVAEVGRAPLSLFHPHPVSGATGV